jgi:LPS sulfotransferase NodH
MRRAYLVLGPESSGSRMLTEALVAAGLYGDAGHVQRLDTMDLADGPDGIVWRRSLPHGEDWPAVEALVAQLRAAGYAVTALVILRQREITAESQVRAGHSPNMATATAKVDKATVAAWTGLAAAGLVPVAVCYEAFTASEAVRAALFTSLGLEVPALDFRDENAKYLGRP